MGLRASCVLTGLMGLASLAVPVAAVAATVLHYQISMGNENHRETGLEKTVWIGEACSRQDEGSISLIIDYRTDRVAVLFHDEFFYVETGRPFAATEILPKEFFGGVVANGFTLFVEPEREPQETSYKWPCVPFALTLVSVMSEADIAVCMAKDVPGVDLEKYSELLFVERFGLHFDATAVSELRKLQGVVISWGGEMELPEYSIETKVVLDSVTDEPLPEGSCEIPEEYEKRRRLPEVP